MKREQKYLFSFTAGALFYSESLIVANLYHQNCNWDSIRKTVRTDNLLQARTPNTAKRISQEIILRLKLLTQNQFELLLSSSPSEQRRLLWVAICKRYTFIRDFASEVIRGEYMSMKHDLLPYDYENFFNSKSETHPEMMFISASTRVKIRQVIFKMLKEAGLISEQSIVQPVLLTHELVDALIQDDRQLLTIFPVSDSDIKGWIKK